MVDAAFTREKGATFSSLLLMTGFHTHTHTHGSGEVKEEEEEEDASRDDIRLRIVS